MWRDLSLLATATKEADPDLIWRLTQFFLRCCRKETQVNMPTYVKRLLINSDTKKISLEVHITDEKPTYAWRVTWCRQSFVGTQFNDLAKSRISACSRNCLYVRFVFMPINSQLLGNVNPQRTEQPRKGRMDSDSVGLAGVASGRDGGISNWTQSFGEDRNSRSLDSFTARATFQNILRCGLVLQFLQGIIMSPKISPACIHYLHLVLMTSTWIFIQIMTSRYDYALQWRWVSIGQKKSHALEFLKLGMSAMV